MDRTEALATLREVEQARLATRAALRSFWFPLAVFGALGLASAPLCALAPGWSLGVYWLGAWCVGGYAIARYYATRERRVGVAGPAWPYVAASVGVLITASLAGMLGDTLDSRLGGDAGPYVAVAAGYVVFALLERSAGLAVIGAALLGASLAAALADVAHACALLAVVFGCASLPAAAVFWRMEASRR